MEKGTLMESAPCRFSGRKGEKWVYQQQSGAGRSVSMTNVASHKSASDPRVQWHTSLWSRTQSVLLTFWQLILQCSS